MDKVKRTIDDYKDIINLPHHVSTKHTKMLVSDRAAQFSPFSAVVGHEIAIKETARLTQVRKELDEIDFDLFKLTYGPKSMKYDKDENNISFREQNDRNATPSSWNRK